MIKRLETPHTGAHNTAIDASGARAFLAGLRSPILGSWIRKRARFLQTRAVELRRFLRRSTARSL